MLRAFASSRALLSSSASSTIGWRALSSSSSSLQDEFERKVALGKSLPPLEDNASKLRMYSLFKQANTGKNTTPKPSGMFDFVGKAKWDAWAQLGDMAQDEAMRQYIAIIDDLAAQHGVDPNSDGATATKKDQPPVSEATSDDLIVELSHAGLLTIQFNRPKRFNAINRAMYGDIIEALESSAKNDAVKAVLLKSSGAMFSSGNDLSMFTAASGQNFEELAEDGAKLLERYVDAFILYPKPVVAAVQGPALGIAVTTLALCDLVYVSEAATFHTPFTALGQSPEACSSLLFPRIMGNARANAMLLLGEKMTAQDAVDTGFATEAFGIAEFDKGVRHKVELLLSRYPNSMKKSKALIRSPAWIAELQEANRRECDVLKKLWLGPECMDAIMKFESRKK